jgi:hypothetical protein
MFMINISYMQRQKFVKTSENVTIMSNSVTLRNTANMDIFWTEVYTYSAIHKFRDWFFK